MASDAQGQIGRIFLARHGRTRLNADGVLRGHLDPPLDSVGRDEAARLGMALADQGIDVVVSSPLVRAVETAQAIASRVGLEVERDRRLIDRDYGPWAGGPKEAIIARFGSLEAAPDVEPASEVLARASEALADIARRVGGGTAAVVSHDVVNRLILGALDQRIDDVGAIPQATGCCNVLEHNGVAWSVASINNVPT